jgi:hypothetical protein
MKTIELSTYNSKEVLSNGEYTCTFPPVQIDNGTQVAISQVFIDSAINGSYQNISVPADLDLHFEFGIYYMNLYEPEKTYAGPAPVSDLYVVRQPGTDILYTDTTQVTVPKGNYTPLEIANIITKLMSAVPPITDILEVGFIPGALLKSTEPTTSLKCKTGTPDTVPSSPSQYYKPITTLHTVIAPVGPIGSAFTPNSDIIISIQTIGDPTIFSKVTVELLTFDNATGTITIAPSNDFIYPADPLQTITSITIQNAQPIAAVFCNQKDYTNRFTFTKPVFMGSSQFALEFDENSGKFQFTQLHMPMYTSASPFNPGVSIVAKIEDNTKYFPADVRSGIFFVNMQPASFWGSLGFNLDTLLVQDDQVTHNLKTPLQRGVNITSQFFGYDGIIAHTYPLPTPSAAPYFYVTDTVISIEADEQLPNSDSGYYLIELVGLTTSYSTDNGNQLSSVMNIASKNYNQSGYITAYADGSVPFVNTGEPFTLTNIKVRILDPLSKKVVTTLGNKNSVFVQITP